MNPYQHQLIESHVHELRDDWQLANGGRASRRPARADARALGSDVLGRPRTLLGTGFIALGRRIVPGHARARLFGGSTNLHPC